MLISLLLKIQVILRKETQYSNSIKPCFQKKYLIFMSKDFIRNDLDKSLICCHQSKVTSLQSEDIIKFMIKYTRAYLKRDLLFIQFISKPITKIYLIYPN